MCGLYFNCLRVPALFLRSAIFIITNTHSLNFWMQHLHNTLNDSNARAGSFLQARIYAAITFGKTRVDTLLHSNKPCICYNVPPFLPSQETHKNAYMY